MKNYLTLAALALISAVLPFALTSCGDSDDSNGTPTDASYLPEDVETARLLQVWYNNSNKEDDYQYIRFNYDHTADIASVSESSPTGYEIDRLGTWKLYTTKTPTDASSGELLIGFNDDVVLGTIKYRFISRTKLQLSSSNGKKTYTRTFTLSEWPVQEDEGDASVTTYTVKGAKFNMVAVESGTFQMGSDAHFNQKPIHEVRLSSFSIGQTEVTQELWESVMGTNPSASKGLTLPVENVTWNDCQTFITKLNQLTGENFRLPTEAEWEYAARGGNKSEGFLYSGSNDIDLVGWTDSNSRGKTHEVGTRKANELGIYDMTGNVQEWCSDWYGDNYYEKSTIINPTGPTSGYYRIMRGGSYYVIAGYCTNHYRLFQQDTYKSDGLGFRLVKD